MGSEVALLDMRLRRRLLVGYSTGMAVYTIAIVALYPQFKTETSLDKLTKNSPTVAALFGAIGSLTSPAGWLGANIYNNFLPLILLLATIGYGASCIAGHDEDGTLCIAAILPFSRRSIVLQKAAALAFQTSVISIATMVCVVAGRRFELSVSTVGLVGATVGVTLLAIDFGLCALAIGCWTGSRGAALGITSTVAAVSYLISSLAPVVAWIRPERYGSLFYWAVGNDQLSRGISAGASCVLLVTGLVLLVISAVAFNRLDLH